MKDKLHYASIIIVINIEININIRIHEAVCSNVLKMLFLIKFRHYANINIFVNLHQQQCIATGAKN